MKKHYSVVVVGAGQAGLSASHYLKQANIEHVVLEKVKPGHAWRSERWDSFCLVTPNWQCQLPGFPYDGPEPQGFMKRDEIVDYLERFRQQVDPPLECGVEVLRIAKDGAVFNVWTNAGSLTADSVVLAAGAYHTPIVPPFAKHIPSDVVQIQSRDYRNPQSLPPGAVLVVGSGQSGCQIAEDLHFAGRQVHLCLGDAPRSPRIYRGKDVVAWLDDMGYYDTPVEAHPDVDTTRDKTNHYLTGRDGGREIDLRQRALEGMKLYGYFREVSDGVCHFSPDLSQRLDAADEVYKGIRTLIDKYIVSAQLDVPTEPPYVPVWCPSVEPTELNLRLANVTAVVFCIGFRSNFRFVELPVFDERGYPRHKRGVSEAPGLYFLGLPWLHTWGSGRMAGVGRDAEHVVRHIAENRR
jgi:putative flavoprotein involved in K+ transport